MCSFCCCYMTQKQNFLCLIWHPLCCLIVMAILMYIILIYAVVFCFQTHHWKDPASIISQYGLSFHLYPREGGDERRCVWTKRHWKGSYQIQSICIYIFLYTGTNSKTLNFWMPTSHMWHKVMRVYQLVPQFLAYKPLQRVRCTPKFF